MICPFRQARQAVRGVTLIEAVLFISVALGLIIGGLVFYRQADMNARVGRQANVLSGLLVEARAIAMASDYDIGQGLQLDSVLIASGAVPASIIAPAPGPQGSRLRTEWDGEIVATQGNFTVGAVGLILQLFDLPVAACARLAAYDAARNTVFAPGIFFVDIREAAADSNAFQVAPPQPFGPADAGAACAARDTGPGGNSDGRVVLGFGFVLSP